MPTSKSSEKLFKSLAVVFSYDNCQDKTLELIDSFKNDFHGEVHVCCNADNDLSFKTHRIAVARNALMDKVRTSFPNTDFHIMMDINDRCTGSLNINSLSKHLRRDDWDCLSFNGERYYDIWALQYGQFIHHCWSYYKLHDAMKIVNYMQRDITNRLNSLENDELFTCYSAFNGFAIYRTRKFSNVNYDGMTQFHFPKQDVLRELLSMRKQFKLPRLQINEGCLCNCEHVSFHVNAIRKNNARIRICKDVIFL